MNRIFVCALSMCALLVLGSAPAFGESAEESCFAGGEGTLENPYQIETAEQLLAMNENLSASYVLNADIDLADYENFPMIGRYVMDENSPEGEDPLEEFAFTGHFDGAGHCLSNLQIDYSQDMEHMFGVGLFSCVATGGEVKNLVLKDIDVKGMMLVGGAVGYAFHCTVDNVDLTAEERSQVESTMVMAGGVIGGLTCSVCTGCDVENTDITAAPGGNSGILGGGFSKPVLEGCTVKNSTLTAVLGEVSMFGMTEGAWIGALTGCVNLDDMDPAMWYVKDCQISDCKLLVSGKGSCVGGLIGACGVELDDLEAERMKIQGCRVENLDIQVLDQIPCVGGLLGSGFSEGEPLKSFQIDGCAAVNVTLTTQASDLRESAVGLLVGRCRNSQFVDSEGAVVEILQPQISSEEINTLADVKLLHVDGSAYEGATLVGEVLPQ